jgi:hypothetical protein
MENVAIWYLSDNSAGDKIAGEIEDLGIEVNLLKEKDLKNAKITSGIINIFIIDLKEKEFEHVLSMLREDNRLQMHLKFVILNRRMIRKAVNVSLNILHIEFISRPVSRKEFTLLIEKSIIVERYREMMRYISKEAEARIEAYENLIDINRKDIFESSKEKEAFEKILEYEKHLMLEQVRLNNAIKEFTILRQKEMFDIKNRVKAEEMLTDLRRQEMMDAHNIIKAQESLIDYSSMELMEANKIINATEKVQELSRSEAIELHDTLKNEKEKNKKLAEEIQELKKEIASLKGHA